MGAGYCWPLTELYLMWQMGGTSTVLVSYNALNIRTPIKQVCGMIDGMYGNFAGRDASRGMAKQSFDTGKLQRNMSSRYNWSHSFTEMLTPIDQPLDKLDDLAKDEMCVPYILNIVQSNINPTISPIATTWKVRALPSCYGRIILILRAGWIDHFTNKYTVCGKLVNNDQV